jgi:hypothetical protein
MEALFLISILFFQKKKTQKFIYLFFSKKIYFTIILTNWYLIRVYLVKIFRNMCLVVE